MYLNIYPDILHIYFYTVERLHSEQIKFINLQNEPLCDHTYF
jgi:hypothetical protein